MSAERREGEKQRKERQKEKEKEKTLTFFSRQLLEGLHKQNRTDSMVPHSVLPSLSGAVFGCLVAAVSYYQYIQAHKLLDDWCLFFMLMGAVAVGLGGMFFVLIQVCVNGKKKRQEGKRDRRNVN